MKNDTTILPVLHCPSCDYNLTGLPENRCPECGKEFDPAKLRKLGLFFALPISASEVAFRLLVLPLVITLVASILRVIASVHPIDWFTLITTHRNFFLISIGALNLGAISLMFFSVVKMAPRLAANLSMVSLRINNWPRRIVVQSIAVVVIAVSSGLIFASFQITFWMFNK